jgi:hypothetical protein
MTGAGEFPTLPADRRIMKSAIKGLYDQAGKM